MAGEIVIGYVTNQTGITGKVYDHVSPYSLLDGPIACPESPVGSGLYIGDSSIIVPNNRIKGFHNGIFIGGEIWMENAVLVSTVSDPSPAGGSDTDMVFDIASGLLEDDEYFNHIITIQDISGGNAANRRISSYKIVGGNRRVTVSLPFEFPLSVGDIVIIRSGAYDSFSGPTAEENATAVWLASKSANKVPGSMGQLQGIQGWGCD